MSTKNISDNMQSQQSVPIVNTELQQQKEQNNKKLPARVFMIEQSHNVDVTSAFEYGPIVPLFKATAKGKDDKITTVLSNTDQFIDNIIQKLLDYEYDPEHDYILIAGHLPPIVVLIATIVKEWDDAHFIKVLFWSRGYNRYVVREL